MMLQDPNLTPYPRLRHGFFTRKGGGSTGLYDSLNCGYGSGDDPDAVTQNRARAMIRLGLDPDCLIGLHQIHSATIVTVTTPWLRVDNPKADGFVTRTPGLCLGILTADCVPVLFYEPEASVIGACHAGWKGALGGVLENTLDAMVVLGAARHRIIAAIGPAIAQDSYEVGADFPTPFIARAPEDAHFFKQSDRPGHFRFDLTGYVAGRLGAAGAGTVHAIGLDTRGDAGRFYSYRRATMNGEADYGRQLSAIALLA